MHGHDCSETETSDPRFSCRKQLRGWVFRGYSFSRHSKVYVSRSILFAPTHVRLIWKEIWVWEITWPFQTSWSRVFVLSEFVWEVQDCIFGYFWVFSWILVYWCYGFWHRLPEEIIILVIFDNSVFFFWFFGGIWILGMEGLPMCFWQSRLVMALWCKNRSRKDFCSCAWVLRGGFQRRGMQSLF